MLSLSQYIATWIIHFNEFGRKEAIVEAGFLSRYFPGRARIKLRKPSG
jgi:hypothetical protein